MGITPIFLLLLACFISHGSCVSISSMVNTTGISAINCNPPTNQYDFTLVNGYIVPNNLIVQLTCSNLGTTSVTFSLAALGTVSGQIGPTTGSIQNRFCEILVYTQSDPFTNQTIVYQSFSSTCGGVAATDTRDFNCGYWNIPCKYDNGQWYYNLPTMVLTIYLPLIAILTFAFFILFIALYLQRRNIKEGHKAHENRVKGDPELKKYYRQYYNNHNTNYAVMSDTQEGVPIVKSKGAKDAVAEIFHVATRGVFKPIRSQYQPIDTRETELDIL